jgi:hypothetical protein
MCLSKLKKIEEMTIYVKENSYVWQRSLWRRGAAFGCVQFLAGLSKKN